ncbi:hypothetical protein AK812_SmicGene25118 [Symbiodinium microadriaticum]|uniref:Uncharacterized protein n=1 Tax=Symbiodinium microadriaticum TaxID=2951 RepID=A0A1Q9DCS0_SYMMI|nr:hypothetical protein AK812_SmicGene25118 [Symbiodinium microadriaticum]
MWGPSRGRRIIADGLTAPKGIQREGSGRVGIMLRRKRPSSPRGMGVGAVIRKRAASPGKQKGYPAVKWEDFVPQDILHLWKELTAWQPDVVGQYVPVEKEQLLRPPPLFLHSTPDLPCRPIERQEALADVELLFAMRFVLQDCSFHTIVSITGNIFIPIIARHFDVSADEELALDEPWAAKQLQDRYEGLTRQDDTLAVETKFCNWRSVEEQLHHLKDQKKAPKELGPGERLRKEKPRPCDTSPTAGGRVLPSAQSPLTGKSWCLAASTPNTASVIVRKLQIMLLGRTGTGRRPLRWEAVSEAPTVLWTHATQKPLRNGTFCSTLLSKRTFARWSEKLPLTEFQALTSGWDGSAGMVATVSRMRAEAKRAAVSKAPGYPTTPEWPGSLEDFYEVSHAKWLKSQDIASRRRKSDAWQFEHSHYAKFAWPKLSEADDAKRLKLD